MRKEDKDYVGGFENDHLGAKHQLQVNQRHIRAIEASFSEVFCVCQDYELTSL